MKDGDEEEVELSLVGDWPGPRGLDDGDEAADIPDVPKEFCCFGAEEIEALKRRMFSGGVFEFWNVRRQLAEKLYESGIRLDEKYVEREAAELGEDEALRRLQARDEEVSRLREVVNDAAAWQQISGIPARDDQFQNPNQRAAGIRRLLNGVERIVRFELNHGPAPEISKEDGDSVWLERSFQWDPLRAICLQYEIAQRKLSALSKELTGMSAIDFVDGIRAEKVRARMKGELKAFIVSRKDAKARRTEQIRSTTEDTEGTEEGMGGGRNGRGDASLADEIFAALKSSRRSPRFHRATWAAGFGYSSYQKFFRACLLCYGMTRHQLEMELIEEILADSEQNGDGNGGHEGHEVERIEHEGTEEAEVVKRE